ncbi:MAG: hypothetical protein LBK95_16495 [Bifidobacteriaceae bacterium]|jgi:hypothetical protein|nr:hypothetical protein [Bifidobacteriaceae bacterium]
MANSIFPLRAARLDDLYRRIGSGKVAFVDESTQVAPDRYGRTFYILAAAVFPVSGLDAAREAIMAASHTGDSPHASQDFWGNRPAFRRAWSVVRDELDECLIAVCAPLLPFDDGLSHAPGDPKRRLPVGEDSRAACLLGAVRELHARLGVRAVVADARDERLDGSDRWVVGRLRAALPGGGRDLAFVHARPSSEPLLAYADFAAWAYRRFWTGQDREWFESIRLATRLLRVPRDAPHVLSRPPGAVEP